MIPVIELLRVSTEPQAQEDRAGLASQHATNVRTAELHGLEIRETVEIVESGATVATSPAMARVLDRIQAGAARGIVVAEYTRLFRPDRWADLVVLQVLSDADARIYLPTGPIDLQTELGFVQATVGNLLGALERRRIRERTTRAKEQHRKAGSHVGGGLPMGFSYDRSNGWAHTDQIEVARMLFRRFLAGERNFAELADAAGCDRATVRRTLANPVYAGWRVYDQRRDATGARKIDRPDDEIIRIRLPLEPIVTDEEWAEVQALLGHRPPRVYRSDFVYTGHLGCVCGQALYTAARPRTVGRTDLYYVCASHRPSTARPAAPCGRGYLRSDRLEPELDAAITRHLTQPAVIVAALEGYRQRIEWEARPSVQALDLRARRIEARRGRVMDAFVDGAIDRTERDRRLGGLDRERQALAVVAHWPSPERLAESTVRALVQAFAEWPMLTFGTRRESLRVLAPRFVVDSYVVQGVHLPVASIARGQSGRHSATAPAGNTSLYIAFEAA